VIAWSKLPKPYEPRIKELKEVKLTQGYINDIKLPKTPNPKIDDRY
jgi:hypothetical protein